MLPQSIAMDGLLEKENTMYIEYSAESFKIPVQIMIKQPTMASGHWPHLGIIRNAIGQMHQDK